MRAKLRNGLRYITKLQVNIFLLYVKRFPKHINLILYCMQQLLINLTFSYKIRYLHLLERHFLRLDQLEQSPVYLKLGLVDHWSFLFHHASLALAVWASWNLRVVLDKLCFGDHVQAWVQVPSLPPDSYRLWGLPFIVQFGSSSQRPPCRHNRQGNDDQIAKFSILLVAKNGLRKKRVDLRMLQDFFVDYVQFFTFFLIELDNPVLHKRIKTGPYVLVVGL